MGDFFLKAKSLYLYFVISKRRVRLDFLRNRRQLRNNAQQIIFDFLFAWLAAHQKIIRADMEDAGQFDQQINGAAALSVLHVADMLYPASSSSRTVAQMLSTPSRHIRASPLVV